MILGVQTGVTEIGNVMVSRVVLLFALAHDFGHLVIVENPLTSLMHLHPRFQWLMTTIRIFRTVVSLGCFGGESTKNVCLWSNRPEVGYVNSYAPRTWAPTSMGITCERKREDGTREVNGAHGLKATQAYPVLFGAAIARLYNVLRPALADAWQSVLVRERGCADGHITLDLLVNNIGDPSGDDAWNDALLDSVLDYLMELRG